MRSFIAALTVGLVLTASPGPAVAMRWADRWDRCRFQSLDKGYWTVHEVKLTIQCAVRHWPVSLDTALYIADRESGFRWHATNRYSGACGIFQHMPRYWPGRQNVTEQALPYWRVGESCYGARVNIITAIRMAHYHGWGPWGG